MSHDIKTQHNAAQSKVRYLESSSLPQISYNLTEYRDWVASFSVEEQQKIRKNYLDAQLECYVKFSVGYLNKKLELSYNRNYDFSDDFVKFLVTKPKSFVTALKRNWCEKSIENLHNLIETYSSEMDKFSLKYPILKQSIQASYGELIKRLKKYIFHYKNYAMSLEENYQAKKNEFSNEDIDRASQTDLSHLFEKQRRSGKNYIVLCPFHNEKTPSMTLFYEKGFHCFGCGKHGSSIDLYMFLNHCNFRDAVEQLLKLN